MTDRTERRSHSSRLLVMLVASAALLFGPISACGGGGTATDPLAHREPTGDSGTDAVPDAVSCTPMCFQKCGGDPNGCGGACPNPCDSFEWCEDGSCKEQCASAVCSDNLTGVVPCGADGKPGALDPCAAGQVCDPDLVACVDRACEPQAGRCVGNEHEVCDRGLAWIPSPCEGLLACQVLTGLCAPVVCEPDQGSCTDGFLSASTCSADGTHSAKSICAFDQVCVGGACTPTPHALGEVAWVDGGDDTVLHGGSYALAVVGTATEPGTVDLPVTFDGEVGATNDPFFFAPAPRHLASAPPAAPLCGTKPLQEALATLRSSPMPGAPVSPLPYAVGDERTFWVDVGGGTAERLGKLRRVAARVQVWEDVTDSPAGALLSDSLLTTIIEPFEDQILDRVQAIFGDVTDVDGNGKVDIFVSPALNSNVAAYVSYGDLFPQDIRPEQTNGGEIMYVRLAPDEPDFDLEAWKSYQAEVLPHELQHMIYGGLRLEKFLADWETYGFEGVYQLEGMADLSSSLTGMASFMSHDYLALLSPHRFSLHLLGAVEAYVSDPEENSIGYGMGSLVMQYLFHQAGGVTIHGTGDQLTDGGGIGYVGEIPHLPVTFDRLSPDGRDAAQWWPDFAAALLLSSLEGQVDHPLSDDPHHSMPPRVQDPYGGWTGPTLVDVFAWDGDEPPLLARTDWQARPGTMKAGGTVFLDISVSAPGTLSVGAGPFRVGVVRYATAVPACEPACLGQSCGDDGCGGTCGECAPDTACIDGACVDTSGLSCDAVYACAAACSDGACVDACEASGSSAAVQAVSAFADCVDDAACAGCESGDCYPPCEGEQCVQEWAQCFSQEGTLSCGELGACLWGCPGFQTSCLVECRKSATVAAVVAREALNQCVQAACGGAGASCSEEAAATECHAQCVGCYPDECAGAECGTGMCGASCGLCGAAESCQGGQCKPEGSATCGSYFDCAGACGGEDGCITDCFDGLSAAAQEDLDVVFDCLEAAGYYECSTDACRKTVTNVTCLSELAQCSNKDGTLTCSGLFDCMGQCASDECSTQCWTDASAEAYAAAVTLYECLGAECASGEGWDACVSAAVDGPCEDVYLGCFE